MFGSNQSFCEQEIVDCYILNEELIETVLYSKDEWFCILYKRNGKGENTITNSNMEVDLAQSCKD